MAKVTGPLFSQEASGTLANLLNYGKSGKTRYARRKPVPTQANSPAQLQTRLYWQSICYNWGAVNAVNQASYEAIKDQRGVTGFGAWAGITSQNWKIGIGPIEVWPPSGSQNLENMFSLIMGGAGATRYIEAAAPGPPGSPYCMIYLSDTNPCGVTTEECVGFCAIGGFSTGNFYINGRWTGQKWINARTVNAHGELGPAFGSTEVNI